MFASPLSPTPERQSTIYNNELMINKRRLKFQLVMISNGLVAASTVPAGGRQCRPLTFIGFC